MGKGSSLTTAKQPNLSGNPVRVDDRGGGALFFCAPREMFTRA